MIIDLLSPHLPHTWSLKHKTGTDPHNLGTDLGTATSQLVASTQPALKWSFTENGSPATLRLTILDQHGHVKVEVNNTVKHDAGVNGGIGNNHGHGASAIIKCTFEEPLPGGGDIKHEYRFEGALLNFPFTG